MTSPEPLDDAQRACMEVAALEAALAGGRVSALDPGERALQAFALALRAAAPRPRNEFNELLDRQIRAQLADPTTLPERSREDDRVGQIRVVVAHRRPRTHGLIAALRRESDIKVGEADDGIAAVELARRWRPDVIVVDTDSPGSAATLKRLRDGIHGIRIVVVGPDEEPDSLLAAISAGAAGYLSRGTIAQDLCRAIRTVRDDDAFVSPHLARHLLRDYRQNATGGASRRSALTSRDAEVLRSLARGMHTTDRWAGPSRTNPAPSRRQRAPWGLRLERWSAALRASGGRNAK
jgi:DNA-binding NarL/FixJ family response regulator